jgi:hypothetical protein
MNLLDILFIFLTEKKNSLVFILFIGFYGLKLCYFNRLMNAKQGMVGTIKYI